MPRKALVSLRYSNGAAPKNRKATFIDAAVAAKLAKYAAAHKMAPSFVVTEAVKAYMEANR